MKLMLNGKEISAKDAIFALHLGEPVMMKMGGTATKVVEITRYILNGTRVVAFKDENGSVYSYTE